MTEIVKIQMPPTSTNHRRPAFIYTKGDKQISQTLDRELRRAMNGDRQAFFEAEFNGNIWLIGKRIEDQNW